MVKGAEEKFKSAELNCSYLFRADMVFDVPQKNIKYYAEKLKLGGFLIDVIKSDQFNATPEGGDLFDS